MTLRDPNLFLNFSLEFFYKDTFSSTYFAVDNGFISAVYIPNQMPSRTVNLVDQ